MRSNAIRPAVADGATVKTSPPPPPLTSIVSVPSPPSLVSSPSPGFQTSVSSPAPPRALSRVPAALLSPIRRSLPSPPVSRSGSSPPSSVSLPSPPSRSRRSRCRSSAVIESSPPRRVEVEPLGGADVEVERAGRGGPGAVERDPARRRGRRDGEDLAAAAAVDLDRVGAVAALVDVVAVAGVPHQRVVAGARRRALSRVPAGLLSPTMRSLPRRRTGRRRSGCRGSCRCRRRRRRRSRRAAGKSVALTPVSVIALAPGPPRHDDRVDVVAVGLRRSRDPRR